MRHPSRQSPARISRAIPRLAPGGFYWDSAHKSPHAQAGGSMRRLSRQTPARISRAIPRLAPGGLYWETAHETHMRIKAPMRKQGDHCGVHPDRPRPVSAGRSRGLRLGAFMTARGRRI